jgi:hypothetical protein
MWESTILNGGESKEFEHERRGRKDGDEAKWSNCTPNKQNLKEQLIHVSHLQQVYELKYSNPSPTALHNAQNLREACAAFAQPV